MERRTLNPDFRDVGKLVVAASMLVITPAIAQVNFAVERAVATVSPSAKERRALAAKLPNDSKSLVAGASSIAYVDLDADGVDELIIYASEMEWCGSLGCALSVRKMVGSRWVEIASLIGDGNIGLVKETATGRYAVAFLDEKGRIASLNTKAYPSGGPNMTPPIGRAR